MPALLRTTQIQEPSSASVNLTLDTSGNGTFAGTAVMSSPYTMRNKIINGAMVIDQRYAGAATANTIAGYTVDRWYVIQSTTGKLIAQQNAGSVTPPVGFKNYLGVTSQSSYSVTSTDYYAITQRIEGFNCVDLNWGTSDAKTITLSFWVRSSLTGTFGGAIRNDSYNYNYPFSYVINSANTWEQKSVTVTGATSGTWLSTNGIGIDLWFGLGVGSSYSATAGSWTTTSAISSATGATSVVGTNGATFYITGVQLERGTVATPFEYRNYQQELAMCQRYYEKSYNIDVVPGTTGTSVGAVYRSPDATNSYCTLPQVFFKATKRATPTNTYYNSNTGSTSTPIYITSGSSAGFDPANVGQSSFGGNVSNVSIATNQPFNMHWVSSAEL